MRKYKKAIYLRAGGGAHRPVRPRPAIPSRYRLWYLRRPWRVAVGLSHSLRTVHGTVRSRVGPSPVYAAYALSLLVFFYTHLHIILHPLTRSVSVDAHTHIRSHAVDVH